MTMGLYIDIMLNDKSTSFSLPLDSLPNSINLNLNKNIEINKIQEISVSENIIIIIRSTPYLSLDTDDDSLFANNTIDAFDWEGNHLWNISDIVGILKVPFLGGYLWTSSQFEKFVNDDDTAKYCQKISEYTQGHSVYAAISDGRGYVIDLDDRKVLYTYPCK